MPGSCGVELAQTPLLVTWLAMCRVNGAKERTPWAAGRQPPAPSATREQIDPATKGPGRLNKPTTLLVQWTKIESFLYYQNESQKCGLSTRN